MSVEERRRRRRRRLRSGKMNTIARGAIERRNKSLTSQRSTVNSKWYNRQFPKDDCSQEEHKETIEQVIVRHKTDLKVGLTSDEAQHRLARDGPNVLTPIKKKPEWLVFLEQFTSVFAMLLWTGAFLSFVRGIVNYP